MNSLLLTDGYKTSHHLQYPVGTTLVYSNFTPRSNKYAPKGCNEIVVFGCQMVVKQIHDHFNENFFSKSKEQVIEEMRFELSMYLGMDYDTTHFEKLHDLGYLPLHIKALEEGTVSPMKVPMFSIYNTHPDFFWLTNYLETIISNLMWKPITSATIARLYKGILTSWAVKTDKENVGSVNFQAHDFSMRGMDSVDAVIASGLGHLTSFSGTDSLPVIHGARKFYNEKGFVAASVPATEHSVMCSGGKESEIETFRRLMETFPKGILSVVSDTWDLWKVITEYLPELKEEILARDGKLVIRPDSGDPVDIICGTEGFHVGEYKLHKKWNKDQPLSLYPAGKGVIELLWDIFGGTVNKQGYKVLDSHIGAIYGDSINPERAEEICKRLELKGFASTNIVLGIGSFTYQFNTRDTFGFAMKATYVELTRRGTNPATGNEIVVVEGREIFKDPITDDGMKKSATGLLKVYKEYGGIKLKDRCNWEEEGEGLLKTIYKDGVMQNETTLTEIRERLNG